MAESRDKETGCHLERMARYVVELAKVMVNKGIYRKIIDENYLELLYESAALHDIGKVGIPDSILNKPGKLSEEEFSIIKTHTLIGMKAIEDIKGMANGQSFLDMGIEVAGYHHEHFDGNGYPYKLKGNSIPLAARILALADFYDACVFPRIYRPFAFSHEDVKKMIIEKSGLQFDPDVVSAFLDCDKIFANNANDL